VNIDDPKKIDKIFEEYQPNIVINLAAQAGVRYSLENPMSYIESNIVGFLNILEGCRNYNVEHLIYASSSSVYGGNKITPFNESHSVDHPVSLYAATKKSNELMAHSYSHLYKIPSTGLRFFTVYGPWGRPDMALFLFTKSILNEEPIKVFNNGEMIRDFTYIDDISESLFRIIKKPATPDKYFDTDNPNPCTSWAPHRIFNIGNSKPISLMTYINAIEDCLGKKAKKEFLPLQLGDVPSTSSDCSELDSWIGFKPKTTVLEGVEQFVSWYRNFYKI
jgi:UDP-glucuronate 4-epimerase